VDWERHDVTACVAALFQWNYGTVDDPDYRRGAIVLSDRKITVTDVEYEPPQSKIGFLTPRSIVAIAGDIAFHSEAIVVASRQLSGIKDASPHNVALIYGQAIQAVKRRRAEDLYLAPLGLNTESFLSQQHDLSADFIDRITIQLQDYKGDEVESLIVAADGESVHLYSLDDTGTVTLLNDLGFGAIGIGAWHARSRLMQLGYVRSMLFAPALAAAFSAKKAAEIAPGVGTTTDICIILKDRIETINSNAEETISTLYDNYKRNRNGLEEQLWKDLQSFIDSTESIFTKE
jgi:20S proteasome alpha/beta subunit